MLLAIDIGNTHMSLGALDDQNHVTARLQMSTDLNETAHEYAAEMRTILALESLDASVFRGSVISSVVPSVTRQVKEAVRILTGKAPLVLGEGARIGIDLDMNGLPPEAIAGDLLATAAAAAEYYSAPAIIMDLGTATTVTVLSASGAYTGGCILPGPDTALKGLVKGTSLLPAVDFTAPGQAIAKDTVNAMRSGIVYGSAGALDGLIDRFCEELNEDNPTLLATGGMAEAIAPHCRHNIIIDHDLLLRGLGMIWLHNQDV